MSRGGGNRMIIPLKFVNTCGTEAGMIIAVPKETFPGERRVGLVPGSVPVLAKAGLEVRIEAGAGVEAGYPDAEYKDKGATIVADRAELIRSADIVIFVRGL